MRIFGLPVPFTGETKKALNAVTESRGGWWPVIREPFTGAWQRNLSINYDAAASFHADFACKTLIARDVAKLRVKLAERDSNDIWSETTSPAFSPVLRKPNTYQTRNQFWETWLLSKLSRGNTYALKVRDDRNVVTGLHVLDPNRVRPLVADDGSVFYQLDSDNLAGIERNVIVPAREIMHDRFNCMFHPLVGTPPVFASGLSCMLGLNAQRASTMLFENNSAPGGILTAPGEISEVTAKRLKDDWEREFSGKNVGRVAVLGDALKYERMAMTAVEGQLIEQLRWSAQVVCSVYHVPPYKIGIGELPAGLNIQSLNVEYYQQGLQSHIEEIEEVLDHGLGIGWGEGLGTEFDIENLLRMDSVTQAEVTTKLAGGAVFTVDEGRAVFSKKPTAGGNAVYKQHQDYSLAALAKRDAKDDPFETGTPAPAALPPPANEEPADEPDEEKLAALAVQFQWALKDAHRLMAA